MAEQTRTPWRLNAPAEAVRACLGTVYIYFEDNHWSVAPGPAPEPRERKPTRAR